MARPKEFKEIILYIEDGVAITLAAAIEKAVTFSGNLVITSTSFPNDASGQAILESFLERVAVGSTVAVDMTGMNATQIAAVNALASYFTSGVFPVQVVREGVSVGGYSTINEAIDRMRELARPATRTRYANYCRCGHAACQRDCTARLSVTTAAEVPAAARAAAAVSV